jgi:hypothetical protein
MQPLIDSFLSLKQEFAQEPAIFSIVDEEIQSIEQWIAEEIEKEPEKNRPVRTFGDIKTPEPTQVQTRGIFDDVDD